MSLDVKDAVGVTKTLKTTLASGEHTPHHIVDGTVDVSGPLTDTELRATPVPVALDSNSLSALENISVTFPSTQNVSVQNASLAVTAASLPLPSGAATSANQSTLIGHVDGIEGLLTTIDADTGSIDTKLPSLTAGGRIPVDIGGNGSITVTSGTITVQNEVEVKNDSGNPVPVSDNGSSLTVDGTVSSNLQDGSGNAITSTTQGATRRLDVMLSSGGATGSAAPTNANLMGGTDGTNLRGLSVDSSGRLNTNINGTVPVSGTVTANNQSVYASGALTLSGTSALSTDLIPSTDVTGYQEVLVQVTGTWPTGATIQHQVSNDNVNFGSIVASTANSSSGTLSSTVTATGSYKVILNGFAYYRLRVTGAGSAGTYSYAYTLNPRSSVFNTSVSVSSVPTTSVNIAPSSGNGFQTHHTLISAASTNATNVKSSAANIGLINLANTTASLRYFKLFNLSVAPTMGTSSPVLNYAIQPNTTLAIDCGYAGIRLTAGLSYAITAGQALLDNTAVGAGDVVVNIAYA